MNKSISIPAKRSPLSVLKAREIFGSCSKSKCKAKALAAGRIFSRCPYRLAFPLSQIVGQEALYDQAHVFLGFDCSGTFVISYTQQLELYDCFPTYVYRLHWWVFNFHEPMKKIHSVKLFANVNNEEMARLQIFYAEWPSDKTKVVVYGYEKGNEKCYITVTAVPSLNHCEKCNPVQSSDGEVLPKRCLEHGFSAHMKLTSVSSNSVILSRMGLKIDNLIIVNMGHSIGVFSLGLLPDDNSTDQLPLSSIKHAAFEAKPEVPYMDEPVSSSTLQIDDEATEALPCQSNEKSESYEISESIQQFSFDIDQNNSDSIQVLPHSLPDDDDQKKEFCSCDHNKTKVTLP